MSHHVDSMSGTPARVEWARRIRLQVDAEFHRVASAFRTVAAAQSADQRARTEIILAILEDQRLAVLSRTEASYFIRHWQEISDQVRQLIVQDPRYPPPEYPTKTE